MNERIYTVYEHVFPNNKRYIGITKRDPYERWNNGKGYSQEHQPVMYNAIQKYGWDNIQHNILYTGLTHCEANEIEQILIREYDTNCHRGKNGYNMTDGGDGASGHIVSDEAKQKMSLQRLGKTGCECPNSQKVICDGIIYDSAKEFCKAHQLSYAAVRCWLIGSHGMMREYYDRGLRYIDYNYPIFPSDIQYKHSIKFDNIVFNSQKDLAEHLGVTPSTVSYWLNKDKIPNKYKNRIQKI